MLKMHKMFVKQVYLLLPLIAGIAAADTITVIVNTDSDFKGENQKIDATNCVSPLPSGFDNSISSINTQGHCVNLYKDEGCTGDYIIVKPGTPVHGNLGHWEGFNDQVSSIGPCDEECNPRNIEMRSPNVSTLITLYDHSEYKGYHIPLDVKGCVDIPRKLKRRVSSIKSEENVCIEFHEHWNCTGSAIQLRKGSPFHDNLGHWGLNDNAGAVSLCGYRCNRSQQPDSRPTQNSSSPGPDIVTLYDEPNFNGNFKDFNLRKGCYNITDEWEGESRSIQIYNQCTIIYELYGCSQAGNNLLLDKSNQNAQRILKTKDFHQQIRSFELCSWKHRSQTSEMGIATGTGSKSFQIVTFTIIGVFIIGLVAAAIIIIRLKRSHKRVIEILTQKEIEEFLQGIDNLGLENDSTDFLAHSQPYDQSYEIPKDFLDIDMKVTLGAGEYAVVYKGTVRSPNASEARDVAVKTVKPYSGVEYVRALLKEIKTMIYVGKHPRIVELVGCCTQNLQNAELFVMTELCGNGCLEKFLQNYRDSFVNLVEKGQVEVEKLHNYTEGNYANIQAVTSTHFNTIHLLQWCLQISEGMEFLSHKKVIHGDLATRNILLDAHFNTKIADFGLSRQLYEYTQYVKKHQAPLPWRWMAIESLRSMRFSTESDVWAFGVTLWEIFSLGDAPYPGLVWGDSFLLNLTDGLRLPKPPYATSDCYNLMLSCWRERPADRVSFPDLRINFQEVSDLYTNFMNNSAQKQEYVDLLG